MREVVKEYGGFCLAAIVLTAVLLLIFGGMQDAEGNSGIRSILSSKIDSTGTDYGAYTDFTLYETEGVKSAPVIEYQDTGYLSVGTISFPEQVKAYDYYGRELAYAGESVDAAERKNGYVKYIKLQDGSGNDISAAINKNTGEITFSEPGIYKVTLCAQDNGCRRTTVTITVAVM